MEAQRRLRKPTQAPTQDHKTLQAKHINHMARQTCTNTGGNTLVSLLNWYRFQLNVACSTLSYFFLFSIFTSCQQVTSWNHYSSKFRLELFAECVSCCCQTGKYEVCSNQLSNYHNWLLKLYSTASRAFWLESQFHANIVRCFHTIDKK